MDFLLSVDERESTALVVEVTGPCAALIIDENHNAAFRHFTPHSPKSLWSGIGSDYTREKTPTVGADEETKTYLRLPWTPHHHEHGYVFGTKEEYAHFKLAPALGRAISSAHFRCFLSKYRTWMIETESSNGTMYRGLLRQFERKALHPDEPNEIRIGDLRLLVHDPNKHVPCQLNYGSYPSGYTESSISQAPSASLRSVTVSVAPADPSQILLADEYHTCWKRPILPDAPRKYVAVRIRDGRPCVVKEHPGTKAQFDLVLIPSRKCESIVSYIEYIESGQLGRTIVTEYIQEAQTLKEKMADRPLDPMAVALMYGNLIGALRFLETSSLIHRDIRPDTILFSPVGFWLTGFSACILSLATEKWTGNSTYGAPEVHIDDRYDFTSDVYSLSLVCSRCISPSDDIPTPLTQEGDPAVISQLIRDMSTEPNRRQFASQIHSYLEDLMGQRLEIPFRSFTVVKKRRLVSISHNGGHWIRAKDLLDAAYTKGFDDQEDIPSYLRQAKVIDKEQYLPLRAARKFCCRFKLEPFTAKLRSKAWRPVIEDEQSVYYHAPSLMYNVDQLLRIAGREAAGLCMEIYTPQSQQEVRGVKAWEGTYIDSHTFKDIATFLKDKYDVTIHRRQKAPNKTLAQRFSTTVAEDTIILVTKQFEYHMLYLRRLDCFVNWNPFSPSSRYCTIEDSISKCNDMDLPELQATMSSLRLESRNLRWPLPHLIRDVDFDSDATSIQTQASWDLASADDSDDSLKFRFRTIHK